MSFRSVEAVVYAADDDGQRFADSRAKRSVAFHHRSEKSQVRARDFGIDAGDLDDVPNLAGAGDGIGINLLQQPFGSVRFGLLDVSHRREV
jgi:hypothetical protein